MGTSHRKPVLYVLTTVTALATAVALLGAAFTMAAPRVADPRPAAIEEAVRAFYAAVNDMIRTGDAAALDTVVAADVVAHGPLAAVVSDRAGLGRYLAALHTRVPEAEVVVENVVSAGNRAVAHLAVRGAEEAALFLDIPVRGIPLWGTVDALHVADGRVVEYWGGADGLALLEPWGEASLTLPAPSHKIVTLHRLTIPPGGVFTATGAEEARLLSVERGVVTIAAARPGTAYQALPLANRDSRPNDAAPMTAEGFTTGALVVVPSWSRTEVRNIGGVPASLMVLASASPAFAAAPPEHAAHPAFGTAATSWSADVAQDASDGSNLELVAGNGSTVLSAGGALVTVGRATLAPGAALPAHETTGPLLLVVERGNLAFHTGGEAARVRHGAEEAIRGHEAATLVAGDGALFHPGSLTVLRNPGPEPLVLLMIAMLPNGPAAPVELPRSESPDCCSGNR